MNLDEAIRHAEEVANANERLCETIHPAMQLSDYGKCAKEHRQLAEWLKELKAYKEQGGDAISRAYIEPIIEELENICVNGDEHILDLLADIKNAPPVIPQPKIGRWIPLEYDGYADGNPVWDKWECSKCGWEHSGDEESLTAFCPNCGTRMGGEQNGSN